jgi:serine/threonine-protein kinase
MADSQASRFWKAALQSGLIDAPGLQACWEAIAPEKRTPDQIDRRLARQAVQSGQLTLWQAQQLMAGRSSGFKIDRYVLLEMIGQGGMGRVYLARDSRLNRRVALKILSPERVNNPRAIARFQREARVGAQLQHENLVRIYDADVANGRCYLVMEYIDGKTVGALIAEHGRIDPAMSARLARQVALGLEHAQQKGMIHRDVNPYNILVSREGVAKLADLGLAIDLSEEIQVTRDGATVGTFDYISPEQARHSRSADTRSDIYSLGCTLYHMLSGQVPYPSPSLPEKLLGHQAVEPEPLAMLASDLPEGLVKVVEKMMRKAPVERYATPREVALALEPFLADGSSASSLRDGAIPRSAGSATLPTMVEPKSSAALAPASTLRPDPALVPTPAPPRLGPTVSQVLFPSEPLTSLLPGKAAEPASPAAAIPRPQPAKPQAASGDDLMNMFPALDLGPEPSLTESLSHGKKPRSRSSNSNSVSSDTHALRSGTEPAPRRLSPVRVGVAVVLALALVALPALFLLRKLTIAAPAAALDKTSRVAKVKSAPEPATPGSVQRAEPAGTHEPEVLRGHPIAVKLGDGTVKIETDLKSALKRAIGSKGHVLLNNATPLKLTGDEAAIMISGGRRLFIRAAEGARPVVEVEIGGTNPFLSTQSDTPLTLVGVTVVAHYIGPARGKEPPPLIEAGATVVLDHCAFTATGAIKGARAVAVEGGSLTAIGCWFEGFDKALDIAYFPGSVATLRQCMIVRTDTDERPIGWGVRARNMPGGSAQGGRRLVLDRCTMKGEGLLDLVDFSSEDPLKVDVTGCAVLAEALLAWETPKPGTPLTPEALAWMGAGNQYDLRGKSWVVLKPEGTPELPDGPTDLAAWAKQFKESDTLAPPVKFLTDPAALPESPGPRDFTILDTGPRSVGADPEQVGPSAQGKK